MEKNEIAFMKDLAAELTSQGIRASFVEETDRDYQYIDCQRGLRLVARTRWGKAHHGRSIVSAYTRADHRLSHYERVSLPECSVLGDRPISAIAKDVLRKVVRPSRDKVEAQMEKIAALDTELAQLDKLIEDLKGRIKGIDITKRNADDRDAKVYMNTAGTYLTGTIRADGKLHIERLSLDQSKTEALLALLAQ